MTILNHFTKLAYTMRKLEQPRWQLLSSNSEAECFTVFDALARKKRTYYVPYLDRVELSDCFAHVFTSNTKIMHLNLMTSARTLESAISPAI